MIIAGAGGAAHLPGMTAAKTRVPVIGVPVQSRALSGQDSLLSIVQMPAGVPVATVAIGKASGAWGLDGDANEVSGNGLNGTIVLADPNGQPNFIEGAVGLALDLSGGDDYVNIDDYKGINIDPNDPNRVQPAFTVMNWFNTTGAEGEMVTWGTNVGRQRLTWRVNASTLRTEHGAGNLRGNTIVNDGEWHHGALTVAEGADHRAESAFGDVSF